MIKLFENLKKIICKNLKKIIWENLKKIINTLYNIFYFYIYLKKFRKIRGSFNNFILYESHGLGGHYYTEKKFYTLIQKKIRKIYFYNFLYIIEIKNIFYNKNRIYFYLYISHFQVK